jgi:hypothetical protein
MSANINNSTIQNLFNTISQSGEKRGRDEEEMGGDVDVGECQEKNNELKQPREKMSFPSELTEWVANNFDLDLSSNTQNDVEERLQKEIHCYGMMRDAIWKGEIPLRIAKEISVVSEANPQLAAIMFGRWNQRLCFPFQSHNLRNTWTLFQIQFEKFPVPKEKCIEMWRDCVAFIKSSTDAENHVVLKVLHTDSVKCEKHKWKDFEATLKNLSLKQKSANIDLLEIFQKNIELFTYLNVDTNHYSFQELEAKWHPNNLHAHVGTFLEHKVRNPTDFQEQRFRKELEDINHLIRVFCDNNVELMNHFKKCLAWKSKNLSKRTGVALVFAGPQNNLKTGCVRWIFKGIFGPGVLRAVSSGLWGILKDKYNGALTDGFCILQVDEVCSKPLELEELERFKNVCDDNFTSQMSRSIGENWKEKTVNWEIVLTTNSFEPHRFPFLHMYSPHQSNRRVLPLVTGEKISPELFKACVKIFKGENPILVRLFLKDCENLLALDLSFVPNQNIPLTPFIEKMRNISIPGLLIKFFAEMPEIELKKSMVAVKDVADYITSHVGSKIDSKNVHSVFKELQADQFPNVRLLEIRSNQNIPADSQKNLPRQTNISAFTWVYDNQKVL